jgi:hypothetical protein
VPYNVGQLGRRLYSRYVVGPTEHVLRRVQEVEEGKFDEEIKNLRALDKAGLKKLYDTRDMEA